MDYDWGGEVEVKQKSRAVMIINGGYGTKIKKTRKEKINLKWYLLRLYLCYGEGTVGPDHLPLRIGVRRDDLREKSNRSGVQNEARTPNPWLFQAEVYIYSFKVQTKYSESNSSFETGYYGGPNTP